MTKTIADTLNERAKTHGSFTDNAHLSQGLKCLMAEGANWKKLTDVQREALQMAVHKFARLLSGNHMERDHWVDAIGYLSLALEEIDGS